MLIVREVYLLSFLVPFRVKYFNLYLPISNIKTIRYEKEYHVIIDLSILRYYDVWVITNY